MYHHKTQQQRAYSAAAICAESSCTIIVASPDNSSCKEPQGAAASAHELLQSAQKTNAESSLHHLATDAAKRSSTSMANDSKANQKAANQTCNHKCILLPRFADRSSRCNPLSLQSNCLNSDYWQSFLTCTGLFSCLVSFRKADILFVDDGIVKCRAPDTATESCMHQPCI